jgi:hypothetical protein
MKIYLLLLLCLISNQFFGQTYIPIDTSDFNKREEFAKSFEKSNELFIDQIFDKYKRKISKRIKENLEDFSKNFLTEIREAHFLFDERFTAKTNEILDEFKLKNPLVPKNTRILVSKNPALNAFCLPDGTFIVNLGLFYWLKNEDQVAGIIAHEISHKILEHYLNAQILFIENELSDDSKDKIKEIKREKYNKSEKAFELYKSTLYAKGDLKKNQEYQADSLGYLLLKNTKYNNLNYLEILSLVEDYNLIKPKGLEKDIYKKIFDLPEQKFKEDWLKIEDFSAYDYTFKEKLNEDSLSTHPETENRIKKLKLLFPELKKTEVNEPDDIFKKLKIVAEYEQVTSLFCFEEYGMSAYICLKRLQENKDTSFYKSWLGKNFAKIYEAKKQYKLNRYVDRIDPKNHSESYIQYLSFIWNLKLDEIKNIMEYYNK